MGASFVIVGSGPGGFYAADALQRRLEGCSVDIIDRLPTPFGLVRGGVAPDHQSTKAVERVFARTATRPGVRFLGGIEVGSTVSYDELKAAYDAVVVAIGCPRDKRLGIPGEELKGVYGSWSFVGWLNGHPGFRDLAPDLSARALAVIGNGNVASDVARILAKSAAELRRGRKSHPCLRPSIRKAGVKQDVQERSRHWNALFVCDLAKSAGPEIVCYNSIAC